MFFISVGIGLYYNVIIAWTLYYFAATLGSLFDDHLPWTTCSNPWNTQDCVELHDVMKNGSHLSNNTYDSAAEEYFSLHMLQISSGIDVPGNLRWDLVLCLFGAWTIVFVALLKGVKSFGKAVYFTALFPYVILTILLARGLTLNGAMDGIRFYITPDWSRLTDVQVWSDAAIQIFFSLGPCWGGLITLASYNKFSNNCFRDAIIIATANCATSFFAGFVVFSFVGFMAYELDKDIHEVVAKGPGLAFIVYPEAVSLLPGSKIWAILFFTMLLALGLGTQFSIMETVVSIICDCWPKHWGKANHLAVLLTACVTMFIIGLSMVTEGGMFVLQLMDNFAGTYSALICGCTEVMVIAYIYGVDRFLVDIQTMFQWATNTKFYKYFHLYWHYMWKFTTPVMVMLILAATWVEYKPMKYDEYEYPAWANLAGWGISMVSVMCIVIGMGYKILNTEGTLFERLTILTTPTVAWGPHHYRDRLLAQRRWQENGYAAPYDMLNGSNEELNEE